jgi:hypothetical protein
MKAFGKVYQTAKQPDFDILFNAVVLLIGLFVSLAACYGLQAALWGIYKSIYILEYHNFLFILIPL